MKIFKRIIGEYINSFDYTYFRNIMREIDPFNEFILDAVVLGNTLNCN